MKKAILASASSGIVAGMLLVGSSTVFADTTDHSSQNYEQKSYIGVHTMRRWNAPSKINALASNLGLDEDEVNESLKSGKTLKQILQDNGIVPDQIHKAFKNHRKNNRK